MQKERRERSPTRVGTHDTRSQKCQHALYLITTRLSQIKSKMVQADARQSTRRVSSLVYNKTCGTSRSTFTFWSVRYNQYVMFCLLHKLATKTLTTGFAMRLKYHYFPTYYLCYVRYCFRMINTLLYSIRILDI
jgi:hypothetical protein